MLHLYQNDTKVFYQGVCSFVKAVSVYGGEIKREAGATPHPLLVVLLDKDNNVYKLDQTSRPLKQMVTLLNVISFFFYYCRFDRIRNGWLPSVKIPQHTTQKR